MEHILTPHLASLLKLGLQFGQSIEETAISVEVAKFPGNKNFHAYYCCAANKLNDFCTLVFGTSSQKKSIFFIFQNCIYVLNNELHLFIFPA